MSEDLLELMEILGTRALQNSSRLSILIALYVLKKAIFSDIVRYTGQPKSSVYQSLQILEDEGLVMVRYAITFKGPRKVIEITSKG
jgi:DNA-binding transcriptional ArsR family regulator